MRSDLPPRAGVRGLVLAFADAFRGIGHLIGTQRNAQIHVGITVIVLVLGLVLRIERVEWVIIVLTIGVVIALEGVNTAIEAAVDLASPGLHPLAAIAKDVAAGAVLVMAIAAVLVGILIFGPRLLALVFP